MYEEQPPEPDLQLESAGNNGGQPPRKTALGYRDEGGDDLPSMPLNKANLFKRISRLCRYFFLAVTGQELEIMSAEKRCELTPNAEDFRKINRLRENTDEGTEPNATNEG